MTTTSATMATMIRNDAEFLKRFHRRNWLILGFGLVLMRLFADAPMTLGMLAGGLISIASFVWLNRSLKNLLGPASGGSKFWMQVLSMLKLVIIALLLMLLIMNANINPIGLLIGLSVVVLNVFFVVIKSVFTGDLT